MNLSETLLTILSKKLKIRSSLLNEETYHIKNLREQVSYLRKIKENDYRALPYFKHKSVDLSNQDLIVSYIITISFLKANTTINISDSHGISKMFYSAGDIGLSGKQKKKRRIAISKLIALVFQKLGSLQQKPIAIHMNNVGFYKSFVLNKLKRIFYVRIIKSFNLTPYNGCRKRKLLRKKYTKNLK